jgi:glycine/D-amino acid oxidase-like deaminating enzyme
MNLNACDFAVIGGGLVGATIARSLASAGLRVIVLDEADSASRASRGNFALVWVQGKGSAMPRYAEWSCQSVSLWREFCTELAAESGLDVSYEQPGGFQLALSEDELEYLRATRQVGRQSETTPYPSCEIMSASEIRSRLPHVGAEVVGGSYCALDGHVNALRLFRAVHQAMIVRGVDYRPNSRVTQIEFDGTFRLRLGSAGTIEANRLLLAAGIDNARLAPMVGLAAPVRAQRGQILVTERAAPFLNFPIATVRQTDEGSVLIGDSQEEVGLEGPVTTGIASVMASRAMRMFPCLAGLKIVRWWDCARVLSPDGYPIYDQSQRCPGAFLATCHSGVTLAAAHAKLLAPAILSGELPEEFAAFGSRRFDVRAHC